VSSVIDMSGMLIGTAISTANYSNLLEGWSLRSLHSGVAFDPGNVKYNAGAVSARNVMTSTPNNWTINDGGILTWTITPEAVGSGTISPSTETTTNDGSSTTFTFTPNAHYNIASVLVDGISAGTPSTYTFTNVTANHTIEVTFSGPTNNMWTANYIAASVTKVVPDGTLTNYPGTGTHPFGIAFDGTNMWVCNNGQLGNQGRSQRYNDGLFWHRARSFWYCF
jgi:hypothetical protein